MKKYFLILVLFLVVPYTFAIAQKPTSDEVLKVVSYYYNGHTDGAMLIEKKFCEDVALNGGNRYDCTVEHKKNEFKENQKVLLWFNFFAPKGDNARILVQYTRNNIVRKTNYLNIGNAFRHRKWVQVPTNINGKWKVKIIQELDNKDIELNTISYNVAPMSKEEIISKKKKDIKKIEILAKKIPATEYVKNIEIYQKLLKLDPENKKYKQKIDYYKSRLKNRSSEKKKIAKIIKKKKKIAKVIKKNDK